MKNGKETIKKKMRLIGPDIWKVKNNLLSKVNPLRIKKPQYEKKIQWRGIRMKILLEN